MTFFKMQQKRTAVLLAVIALIGMSARDTFAWSQEQSALIPPQEETLQLNLDALPVLFLNR